MSACGSIGDTGGVGVTIWLGGMVGVGLAVRVGKIVAVAVGVLVTLGVGVTVGTQADDSKTIARMQSRTLDIIRRNPQDTFSASLYLLGDRCTSAY